MPGRPSIAAKQEGGGGKCIGDGDGGGEARVELGRREQRAGAKLASPPCVPHDPEIIEIEKKDTIKKRLVPRKKNRGIGGAPVPRRCFGIGY